ncbi:MAG: T9SS type A sorting domain-containing protein [Bacteroidia bacterium]
MTKRLLIIAVLLITRIASAQTLVWDQTYTIAGSNLLHSTTVSHINGVYTAGEEDVTATGVVKLRVTRHSNSGVLQYTNAFQFGSAVNNLGVHKIDCDSLGNIYVMVTAYKIANNNSDCYLLSYSPTLSLRWIRSINSGNDNTGGDFTRSSNGNIYAAISFKTPSTTTYNIAIHKVNMSTGVIAYSGSAVTGSFYAIKRVQIDASGNTYICSNVGLGGSLYNGTLSRFSSTGVHSWTTVYTSATTSYFNDMTLDNFGNNIYICGTRNSAPAGLVLKYNTSGANTGSYILSDSDDHNFMFISYAVAGSVTVYGYTKTNPTNFPTMNLLLVNLNSALSSVISTSSYPTSGSGIYNVLLRDMSMVSHPNGSQTFLINMITILAGGGNDASYLVKINASGGVVFSNSANNIGKKLYPFVTTSVSNTDFLLTTTNYRTQRYTSTAARISETEEDASNVAVYPNPARDYIYITGADRYGFLQVIDLNGRVVIERQWNPGEEINVASLAKGMYLIKLHTEDGFISKKVIVE